MQELVNNIATEPPKAYGTQIPEKPLATPVKTGTFGTTSGLTAGTSRVTPGGFIDLIGNPDLASPMNWSGVLLPSIGTLWK